MGCLWFYRCWVIQTRFVQYGMKSSTQWFQFCDDIWYVSDADQLFLSVMMSLVNVWGCSLSDDSVIATDKQITQYDYKPYYQLVTAPCWDSQPVKIETSRLNGIQFQFADLTDVEESRIPREKSIMAINDQDLAYSITTVVAVQSALILHGDIAYLWNIYIYKQYSQDWSWTE